MSDIALGDGVEFRRTLAVETGADGVRRLVLELKPRGGQGGNRPPVRRVYESIE